MSRQTRVIELVGPAGVGKTTVRRLLANQHGYTPRGVWRLPPRLLLWSGVRLLPTAVGLYFRAGPAWEEMRQMIRLDALYRLIERHDGQLPQAWLLDEGPVFVLAWLRAMGHVAAGPERLAGWWRGALARCRRTVDLIVMLDAPNEVLRHRIRNRAKHHLLKNGDDDETTEFLDRYRRAYTDTVADLTSGNGAGPRVLQIETHTTPAEAIAAELAHHLNGRRNGH